MWETCRTNVISICFVALILICLFGCSDSPTDPEDNGVSIPVDARLVSANTRFGFKLFKELTEQDAGKNVFISPSSIAFALAMVYNGASGETQQAMANALELQGMSLQEVNEANAALMANLENPSKHVDISIANSIWMREGFTFEPDFLKRNEDFYEAEIGSLDFADPGAPGVINDWVGDKTRGKIDRIIDNISTEATLILLNALYFQGTWTVKFDKGKTYRGTFTLLDGSKKEVQMMCSKSDRYKGYYGGNCSAVSIPYGGGRISMYIFLPEMWSSLEEFHQTLSALDWENWMSRFQKEEIEVHLPRFTTEYEVKLNDALKAIGMEVAFDRFKAEFRNMCPRQIWIDEARHKTYLEVNEEGTTAAAATAVEMTEGEPFSLIVNRPFFCAIRDNDTGAILFMGSIVDPQSN